LREIGGGWRIERTRVEIEREFFRSKNEFWRNQRTQSFNAEAHAALLTAMRKSFDACTK
jgi:hypothetical protein